MNFMTKNKKSKKNSESGFVLIAAIMGIMILLAVGFIALSISTSDLRIAARLIGERKAFSAAESGVQAMVRDFQFSAMAGSGGNVYYDTTNDPTARYRYDTPVLDPTKSEVKRPGDGLTTYDWCSPLYCVTVTGEDTTYNSKAEIEVGVVPSARNTCGLGAGYQ